MFNKEAQNKTFNLMDWREEFIVLMLRLASLFGIFALVISFPTSTVFARILFIGLYLILLAAAALRIPYVVKAYTLIALAFIIGVNALIGWGPWADGSLFLLASIVLASILLDNQRDLLLLIISVFSAIVIAILQQTGVVVTASNAPALKPENWAVYIIDFSVVGAMLVAAAGQFKGKLLQEIEKMRNNIETSSIEKKQLEEAIQEHKEALHARMEQVHASSNAARTLAGMQTIKDLLDTVTRLVSDNFGYYHVGLLILDEQKRNAYMQSSSSAVGTRLIGQAIRLQPDKSNPLATALNSNHPVIMTDANPNTFVRDPNFPLTRSRMILPLAIHNEVIGLLDIHSDQPQVFHSEDAEILQILAYLTAISFDNVRLVTETKSLIDQLDINAAIQTKRTWRKLTSKQKPAYQYTLAGVRPVFSPDKRVGAGDLLVPLILQGQKIGTIKLKRKSGSTGWSEREQSLIEKIADQVALALENSRLVDEAQRNALQDQMIANISTQIRETLDIEAVIRTASTELRRVFDLKEAEIVVGSVSSDLPGKKNTSSLGIG